MGRKKAICNVCGRSQYSNEGWNMYDEAAKKVVFICRGLGCEKVMAKKNEGVVCSAKKDKAP